MPYRFEVDETLDVNLRRCSREQLQGAIDRITADLETDPVDTIHDARKAIKKERSLLRLAAAGLGPGDRKAENGELRSIAHELAGTREADALVTALDDLAERYAGQVPEQTVDVVRERLVAERDLARGALLASGMPEEMAERLRGMVARVDDWHPGDAGWPAIADGLARSYQRGRKAMRRARKRPSSERMHEWRKRSKDVWYHLRLLKPLSPGILGGAAKDAHRLADALGDVHDLALLDAAIGRLEHTVPDDLEPLHGLIEHRGEELRDEAFALGDRVFAESPKRFCKRIERYWRAWRSAFQASAEHNPAELAEATRHPAAA
jgi:CHAD domain-containing protein